MSADLVVEQASVTYRQPGRRTLTAVDEVSLSLAPGEVLGLVGESGCGKSTLARAVCGLQPAGSRLGGTVTYDDGTVQVPNLLRLSPRAMNRLRGRRIAMVFQDPTSSLQPMLSIGAQ
ncbi:MAG: peptide/nickel transport system ATP-binding protein, partial [Microbacteriaceae bacterium]|nr:peptide/nickel transport system ATP-binding protein [Microbacteriaceae bacterium]